VRESLGHDSLRRGIPLDEERRPLPMPRVENADLRRKRAFPEQPPTIPHAIESYQLDKNSNACMRCHSRASAEDFQAPMISVTHYLNRDGQVLASIAPRRYFCTHCHVVQTDAKPLVGNQFRDVDELIAPKGRARD
jgi:cytochrome c-type protein NapB